MRAARWHAARDLRVDDVPAPEPRSGQVLVAVERTGICGTDLEEYLDGPLGIPVAAPHPVSGRAAPLTLGHEIVGTVATCPGGELAPGARVVPDVVVGCGGCWWCRRHQEGLCPDLAVRGLQDDGGLAEYVVADAATCVPVPDGVPPDVAAFAEPLSVAVRALRKFGDLTGATLCVNGAGVIGQLVVQVALSSGAHQVVAVDPVESRRSLAARTGATAASPESVHDAVHDLTARRGADAVIECSGAAGTLAGSVRAVRPGGTVVLVGLGESPAGFPLRTAVLEELHVVGSAAHLWDEDVASAVALLTRGRVDPTPLLSARIDLDAVVADGFERLARDREVMKILAVP